MTEKQKQRILAPSFKPLTLPLDHTLVAILSIDHWHIEGLWKSTIFAWLIIVWISTIEQMFTRKTSEPVGKIKAFHPKQ